MTAERSNQFQWAPRTLEDELLDRYWRELGGRLYAEVPIAGPGGSGKWPAGCTVRRLDGVRFLAESFDGEAWHYSSAREKFSSDLAQFQAEIIEVKQKLNRGAIGQAIVGRRMFHRQYAVAPIRTVIVCKKSDSALAWVCEEENIVVASWP